MGVPQASPSNEEQRSWWIALSLVGRALSEVIRRASVFPDKEGCDRKKSHGTGLSVNSKHLSESRVHGCVRGRDVDNRQK